MRQEIQAIIDPLFRDVEPTEEARSLREELAADLEDRYADLLASGMDGEAALAQLRDAVTGFEAVTADLPHRRAPEAPAIEAPAIEAPAAAAPAAEKAVPAPDRPEDGGESLPVAGLSRLCVRLASEDLRVELSPDDRLHLLIEGQGRPVWKHETSGGTLTLTIEHEEDGDPDGLGDIDPAKLDGLGRALLKMSRMTGIIRRRINVYDDCVGTVRIPAGWLPAMELDTASGDITVSAPAAALTARTASGDLVVDAFGPCRTVDLKSISGDIQLTGGTESLTASTTSGDMTLRQVEAPTVRLRTVSGDAGLEGRCGSVSYQSVSGDVRLVLSGPVRSVTGSSVSGDADIRLPDGQPARVAARSTSGSIRTSCPQGPNAADLRLTSVSGNITVSSQR